MAHVMLPCSGCHEMDWRPSNDMLKVSFYGAIYQMLVKISKKMVVVHVAI